MLLSSYNLKERSQMKQVVRSVFLFLAKCIYRDLRFEGGDIKIVADVHDFRQCKKECESYKECFFFTSSHFGCFLKNQDVEIQKEVGYISGASDAACGGFLLFKCFMYV